MGEQLRRAFRYERKFLVERMDAHQIRALVKRHPSMFYAPYPPRYVNNLYLDTQDLQNYHDNVSGVGARRKVRIRWYGDLFGAIQAPALEFKIKRGLVGAKQIYALPAFTLDDRFDNGRYQALLARAQLPADVHAYVRHLRVVLCNRYYRWYFATHDGRFRVTVDAGMVFYRVKRARNRFRCRYADLRHVVVELKYPKASDLQAERVSRFFPFSLSKNSKYVTGIETVYA